MQIVAQSSESEAAVLGCVILEPSLLPEVGARVGIEDFYDLRHRNLYEVMLSMEADGKVIDLLSLRQEATTALGTIEKVGGMAYLSSLPNLVASAAHLPYALGVMADKSRVRKFYDTAQSVLKVINSGATDGDKIEGCGLSIAAALETSGGGELNIKEVAKEAMSQIETAFEHEGECTGIPTGFPALDSRTTGLHAGELVILAARPGMGKTSLAMGVAEHLAVDGDIPVGVLSLEMKSTSLVMRSFASRAGIDGRDLRAGKLLDTDFPKLNRAFGEIAKSKLYLDDSHGINLTEASARIRRMVRKHGCKLVVIDYLQLMHAGGDHSESRVSQVTRISNGLKSLANQLSIPILCLSQLNRAVETSDRPPRLSDLRESGSIEQDADMVWFLYQDDPESQITRLIVAKNRSGPTGEIALEFQPKFTRYITPRIEDEVSIKRPVHPDFHLEDA